MDIIILVFIIVIAISAGALAWKTSKVLAVIFYVSGIFSLIFLCEAYYNNRVAKSSEIPKLEQSVEIITYKTVCGVRIPIDTIYLNTKY